ncbi:HTH-like domain-containing protein [Thermoanaerobacter thermohydrosulfuricus]|uniref:HTH-like domain-containing protein n=1 Tax=Thermoanaerobacter thermohydrosulfuricus TaxID=1516 RepID=A0A1G7S6S6_THETY|nr:IS3 family transposase [Thermoanaerobacter thermohydrosulfuricus]SDG18691.1 HTH-like domain-containing protein [Thermoanaerobacter thermohydrosulfuricus]
MYEEEIMKIYKESKKRYGAPKIHKMPINKGYNISLKKVQRLMNRLGIKSIIIKKFKPYTSKNRVEEKESVLNRDFSTNTINEE